MFCFPLALFGLLAHLYMLCMPLCAFLLEAINIFLSLPIKQKKIKNKNGCMECPCWLPRNLTHVHTWYFTIPVSSLHHVMTWW